MFYALCLIEIFGRIFNSWKIFYVGVGVIALITFGIEAISVATGYPFGSYNYTNTLGHLIAGVPFTIAIAWVGVILNSMLLSNQKSKTKRAVETGVWVVVLDLILDPVAEKLIFWEWHGTGAYFGIPLSNFITWFILSALLTYIFPLYKINKSIHRKGALVFQLMLFFFGMLGFKTGLVAIGCLSMLFIILVESRYRYDYREKK
ncbi:MULTISPECIES: carotenoid biosynthesis protein [Paraliobacillus]|uniref:carotenoid biosynthesis protein n=1 Tax=Paraliobacillus TaxID=200903 RepID=UPI001300B4D8|nr:MULTISPECIES: carotenoid biosynthesis protein [Paraliobacillus]